MVNLSFHISDVTILQNYSLPGETSGKYELCGKLRFMINWLSLAMISLIIPRSSKLSSKNDFFLLLFLQSSDMAKWWARFDKQSIYFKLMATCY